MDDALFPHHLNAECTARILGLLDLRCLLSLTLVSRNTRLVALPALLYRVNLHDDGALGNPNLLSFRTFVCDHSLGHHVRYFSYTFDGHIIHLNSSMADMDWMRALADIFQVCRGLVSLALGQVCEQFFVHDPRLAPTLLSLHSLVELRLYGVGDVGLHSLRQIHGLRHLTLSADLYSDPVHSLDVSHIMLGLADVLEELVLRDTIPSWHALWEQSAAAGTVCRNVKKLIILPSRSPSPRYLAHMFPDVRFLWIDEYGDVDEELTEGLSSSSSQIWPALTAVKSQMSVVTKLASHCPSLQSIIAFAANPPSVPDVLTFLDAVPLNRITTISFPLSLDSTSDFVWRSAYQITPILAKLSVDATRLQFLSLSIHIDRWSSDSTQDVLKLVSYLHLFKLAHLCDLRYLFLDFIIPSIDPSLPPVYTETSKDSALTAAASALDIMSHLPDLEYFELGLGTGHVQGIWYEAFAPKSLRPIGTSLWKRERGVSSEDARVGQVLNDDEWMWARAMYQGI